MEYRRRFLLEKAAVQVLGAAAVAAVYFLPALAWTPSDPDAATSFVLAGDLPGAARCALLIWVLAAVVGAVTVFMRPQGAMLIVLLGAGGTALRSAQIRAWLWQQNSHIPAMYGRLAVEIVAGAAVLFAAAVVVDFTRRLVARVRPAWLWRSPLEGLTDEEAVSLDEGSPADVAAAARVGSFLRPAASLGEIITNAFRRSRGKGGPSDSARELGAVGVTAVIGMAATMLLMQSPARGQIIFSLLAAFFAATLIANALLAPRHSLVVLTAPVAAGLLACGLGALTSVDHSAIGWANVKLYARALPIDWLFAGGAGVLLASWVAHRHHEWKRMAKLHEELAA